jgi:hypothetical protein
VANPPPKKKLNPDDYPGAPEWLGRFVEPLNIFIEATNVALDRGVTYAQNFAGEVKTVSFTAPGDWVTPTLTSGWSTAVGGTNPRPLQYRKTMCGEIRVRGRVTWTGGSAPATGTTIFEIGASNAPSQREVFDCYASNAGTYGPAILSAYNGAVRWESGGYQNLSLSGDVWWEATDPTPPRWDRPLLVKLGTPARPFPGRPGQVHVLGCRKNTQSITPVMTYSVDWSATLIDGKDPAIQIHKVWGVQEGVSYNLVVLVLPE